MYTVFMYSPFLLFNSILMDNRANTINQCIPYIAHIYRDDRLGLFFIYVFGKLEVW